MSKNIFVYCEITEEGHVADVSLELCSRGYKLAKELGVELNAIAIGNNLNNVADEVSAFGVNNLYLTEDEKLFPYLNMPHSNIVSKILKEQKADIVLFGATSIGRDLAPRVASTLKCGLTADCTSLEIGDHYVKKTDTTYKNLLYQIRPAFGGNIVATIINPDMHPQMATVREGVMKLEPLRKKIKPEVIKLDVNKYVSKSDFAISIIDRQIEAQKINIKGAQIIIAGGYGVGSKKNFGLLNQLAELLGGEVGASRAAVDAGYAEHERQIGQTGVTVRPKLYIACGISGAVQHTAGMDQSAQVISINIDEEAPISNIADYNIIGTIESVIPKMIKYYRKNSK
ncbi:MAG: electron transfer flavoprotein subunit alpha/FixB family protein [Bacteroidales bacterium]|nr:electron transfer flavoprotein subunit alpha/FixB family protein [Bacteroidales bacterium]